MFGETQLDLSFFQQSTRRFNELRRLLPNLSQRVLTNQLRELESDGLVSRKIYAETPPKVEYSITEFGRTLEPVLLALTRWADQHMLPRMTEKKTAETKVSGADVNDTRLCG